MIIKSHLRNDYEKTYTIYFFYIHKEINIRKTHKIKKKLNIKLIFSY